MRPGFRPAILALPLMVLPAVALLDVKGALPAHIVYRDGAEVLALWVLAPMVGLAWARVAGGGGGPLIWVACLLSSLLGREIHFSGTSAGIYLALLLLFAVLTRKRQAWSTVLANVRFSTPLVGAMACYVASQSMDQRWWQFLPDESIWHTPVEESLEIAGHVCAAALALLAPKSLDGVCPESGAAPRSSR